MIPLRSFAASSFVVGPQVISRFNNYRAVTVNGAAQRGRVLRRCAEGDG